MSNKLIGTSPNQVPSNADLGTLAYQDADNVNLSTLLVTDRIGIDTNSTDTLNSPYLFTVADESHGVAIDYVNAYPTKPGGLFSTAGGGTWPFNQYGNMILTTRTDYGGYYDIALVTASSNNTPVARLVVKSSGNVGIGTENPTNKLHVNGTNASIGVIGTPKSDWYTTAYNGLQVADSVTVWGRASDSHLSGNYYVKDVSGVAKDSYINNGYAHDLWFDNGAGTLTYRHSTSSGTGDAQITTWNTALKILPNGSSELTASKAYGSDTGLLRLRPSFTGTNYAAGGKINIVFGHESVTNSHIGEVRVTQTNPSASTASTMEFFTNGGGGNTATTAKMKINPDGNTRIGTGEPYSKLDVAGPIQDVEYAITNNSQSQWSKIGTIYGLYQSGTNIHIKFKMHSGYNAQNYQDYSIDLFMKTSNGSSTNPSGGMMINSWWYKIGNSGAAPRFKWKKISTNDYELFMFVPGFAGNSSYTVKKSAGQWANSGAVLQSDPGADSSTVLEAENKLGFYSNATFNENLKVTKAGGFYNNGVREYSQYIDNLVNNANVNFDVPVTRTGSGYTVYYECMYNHFGNTSYGSWRSGFFSFRSDNNNTYYDDVIKNHGSSSTGGGGWTVSLIGANTATPFIRFNKNAGTYVGGGDGHIFVRGGAL